MPTFMQYLRSSIYAAVLGGIIIALPAAAEIAVKDRAEVERIIHKSKSMGPRGWGFTQKSLEELSEKLISLDAPMAVSLLYDGENQTGASFAVAALCDSGAIALGIRINSDSPPPIDRARDSLNLMQSFSKCTAETRAKAQALMLDLDAAVQRRAEKSIQKQKDDAAALQRHNEMQMKLLSPEGRKSLTAEERQEIFDSNVKALHLDGPRDADQERLYQMMKKSTLGDGP